MYNIAPWRSKIQRRLNDKRAKQSKIKKKPNTVDRPVRTACSFVHHSNGTRYCITETVLMLSFLQTNIISEMWQSERKGTVSGA